ncbi:hypothetical protein TRFO_03414 [Tritrichomonas foetus]|uniref:Uncharacterized protein n=1 Tax=Tritrichomonas foetus TaxID=1144522 RepID=A0A1J4KNZ9_9EUKA|nr:hypothetical protein TRFO_03414 [Tritrichomonas foetus]|eukprot:OHT13015.1 hypothetical protein TRFO_03414 [Tritrichomonas foetus]
MLNRTDSLDISKTSSKSQPRFASTAPLTLGKRKMNLLWPPSDFGRDARKVRISPKYPETKPPPEVPGPGAYNPREHDIKLKQAFPRAIKDLEPEPVTANIGFYNPPTLVSSKGAIIHTKINIEPKQDDVPGPQYTIPSIFSKTKNAHKIASQSTEMYIPKNQAPPPGAYTPVNPMILKSPAYTVQGNTRKNLWLQNKEDTPSPANYSPQNPEVLGSAPRWTIGNKSRKGRSAHSMASPGHREVLIIDKLTISLSGISDVEKARKYYAKHPEIKEIVLEIIEMMLEEKPKNPLEVLRAHYNGIKNSDEYIMTIKKDYSSESELDV